MISLDFSPFANLNNKLFKEMNATSKYGKLITRKAIFDEIHIIENADVPNTTDRKDWTYDTVFLWHCNNLEAGNIGLNGLPINELLIKRRRKNDLTFEDVKRFKFDPETQSYSFKDRFIESYEDYVYGIQPLGGSTQNPILGDTTTSEVSTEFESAWLVGKEQQFQLYFNLEVGDYENVVPSEVLETLGGQYPIVFTSGNLRYKRGSIKCLLASDSIYYGLSPKEEKIFRKTVVDFLLDKKPKLFKDGSGEYMLISLIGNPILTPNNNVNQFVYDLSIDFVEVGDANIKNFISSDLLVISDDN